MDINFICTKKRKEFGKPCGFTDFGPSLVLEIDPDPQQKEQFLIAPSVDREIDNSTKMCTHEVNTVTFPTESRGMNHMEGGWPAAVDNTDEESMVRFRKKVEKDKSYVNSVKSLADFLENFIMENNSIDIYEEYFEGERLKHDFDMSITALSTFKDVNETYRSIIDLSWGKDSTKFAAAYVLKKGKEYPLIPCIDSYVWDIEESINPVCVLTPEVQMSVVEFSPTNLNLLVSGYESGQVALWDIRYSGYAQQLSTITVSHKDRVTGIKWLKSKQEMAFFSTSTDGKIISWDARNLSTPTETVELEPGGGDFPNLDQSYSISCAAYDASMPYNFKVGTEQGMVLSFNRKYKDDEDKLISQYDCNYGPLLAVEANTYFPQLFSSCDAWSIKLWSDTVTNIPVINIVTQDDYFTDVAWSPTRASTLFATKTSGFLEVWDIPGKNKKALLNTRLDKEALLSVAVEETGGYVICGSLSGTVQLVKVPEYLRNCSELEAGLVRNCVKESEEIIGGKPRSERFFELDIECSESGMDEEWWDPPDKAEDLREECIILFEKFPLGKDEEPKTENQSVTDSISNFPLGKDEELKSESESFTDIISDLVEDLLSLTEP